jgi:hypothetical protein
MLPTPACPYTRQEWFIDGTQPRQPDTLYKQVTIDSLTGALSTSSTPADHQVTRLALVLPPSAQTWARSHNILLLNDLETNLQTLIGADNSNSVSPTSAPLQLTAPAPASIYKLAQGLDLATQGLHLAAAGEAGLGPVTFYIDGAAIATIKNPPYETWWPLSPGVHQVWASATRSNGEKITSQIVDFTVK